MMMILKFIVKNIVSGFLWGFGLLLFLALMGLFSYKLLPYFERMGAIDYAKSLITGKNNHNFIKATPTVPINFDEIKTVPVDIVAIKSKLRNFNVSNTKELYRALALIEKEKKGGQILIGNGIYQLNKTIYINSDNVQIRSYSGLPEDVVIKGKGMYGNVGNLLRIAGDNFVLEGITLQDAKFHLIQIASESGANNPILRNNIFKDSYQQLIKVSYNVNKPNNYSINGLIENCLFYYSGGVAPNYYTAGIDAHGIRHWIIKDNVFKNIASPGVNISEYAIHLWNNSAFNTIEGNVIIDSDRGIGLGMGVPKNPNIIYGNYKGIVKNNFIYHSKNNHPFSDAAIVLESSPKSIIKNNYAFMAHNYNRAIEYRFDTTKDVKINNNKVNKIIASRNGGKAILDGNDENLELNEFLINLNSHLSKIKMKIDL